MLNSENIKQEIDGKLTFILEITLQQEHFLAKYDQFFS